MVGGLASNPPFADTLFFRGANFKLSCCWLVAPSAGNAIKTNKKQLFLPRSVAANLGETSLGRRHKKKATQLWPAALGRALARIAHISEEKWKNAPPWIYSPVILGPLNKKKNVLGENVPQKKWPKNGERSALHFDSNLIYAWTHTCRHTYIHTYIHTCIHTYTHTCIHTRTC